MSTVSFPLLPSSPSLALDNVTAPRIKSTKHKIEWSEEGIHAYQELLLYVLSGLQNDDFEDLQPGSASLLFQVTNHILTSAAKQTNKVIDLTKTPKKKKAITPPDVLNAMKVKATAHKQLLSVKRNGSSTESKKKAATEKFQIAKSAEQNFQDYQIQ